MLARFGMRGFTASREAGEHHVWRHARFSLKIVLPDMVERASYDVDLAHTVVTTGARFAAQMRACR